MKFKFHFEIFGKKMTASLKAESEGKAREILFQKIFEAVKVTKVESDEAGELLDFFSRFGINLGHK